MQRYNQSVNEVLEETKSQLEGLKPKEVELRQAENGFNELKMYCLLQNKLSV